LLKKRDGIRALGGCGLVFGIVHHFLIGTGE
jgi:hypothetical protein